MLIVESSLSDGETRNSKKNYRHWQAHLSTLQLKAEMVYLTGCSESNGTYCFGILPDFFSITNESVPCRDSFLNTAKMKWPNFTNIFS